MNWVDHMRSLETASTHTAITVVPSILLPLDPASPSLTSSPLLYFHFPLLISSLLLSLLSQPLLSFHRLSCPLRSPPLTSLLFSHLLSPQLPPSASSPLPLPCPSLLSSPLLSPHLPSIPLRSPHIAPPHFSPFLSSPLPSPTSLLSSPPPHPPHCCSEL